MRLSSFIDRSSAEFIDLVSEYFIKTLNSQKNDIRILKEMMKQKFLNLCL